LAKTAVPDTSQKMFNNYTTKITTNKLAPVLQAVLQRCSPWKQQHFIPIPKHYSGHNANGSRINKGILHIWQLALFELK
jgi:hypothetical protein